MKSLRSIMTICLMTGILCLTSNAPVQAEPFSKAAVEALEPLAKNFPTGNYTPGEALTHKDFCLYGVNNDAYEQYDYDAILRINDVYGGKAFQVELPLDQLSLYKGKEEGLQITYRNIILGQSTKEDVLKAYGDGTQETFDQTDSVYSSLSAWGRHPQAPVDYSEALAYMDANASEKITYTYDGNCKLVFLLDKGGTVSGWFYTVE